MKSSLHAAALVLVAGTVTAAQGTILAWDALFNGNASTANNWNPNQVPTAVDDLGFNSAFNNNYTVTYDSLVATVRSHQYRGDNVTIHTTNAGGHTISNSLSIENGSEVLLNVGRLNVPGTTTIGLISGAAGSLTLDQTLFTGGAMQAGPVGGGDIFLIHAARAEVGAVTLNSGSVLRATDAAFFQATSLSLGTAGSATASLAEFLNGTLVRVSGSLNIASDAGTSAAVRAIDGTPFGPPDVDVAGTVRVGANATAAAAGTGALVLQMPAPGHFPTFSCGPLIVGDANGGQGSVLIDGGDLSCASATFVPGHSSLTVDAGTFSCSGAFTWTGTFAPFPAPPATTGNGSVSLRGPTTINGDIQLSANTGGALDFGGIPADATMTGNVFIAPQAGRVGRLSVQGGASAAISGVTIAGQRGEGLLFVSSGHCTVHELDVGSESGSSGGVTVAQGVLTVASGGLWVGGTPTSTGGAGIVALSNGGRVFVSGGMRVREAGTISVSSSGLLQSDATIFTNPGAEFVLDDGQLTAPSLAFTGGASTVDGVDLTGNGTVDAAISSSASGNNITATGPLTLGKSTSTIGYNGPLITLAVGANTVTLLDANSAVVGDTSIAAGTLAAANGLTISGTRTISGGGTIDAPTIVNVGTINATTPQGFVLKGIVSGTGTLTGTLFDFSNTGGFTGAGTINSQIRGTAGSVITSTGALSLGTASTVGFSFDGTLRTGANTITLHDTSNAFAGNIELAGGTLFCTDTDLSSDLNDVASGFGTIGVTPRTWFTAGTIRPGGSGADTTGQISVAGNVNAATAFHSSTFDMEIGGTTASNMDRFVVAGALTIDGTLRVRYVPGYVPFGGELYTVITANSIAGNFTNLDLPPRTRVIVNATNVQVEALCLADQNADGSVDGDDVIDLFAAWDLGLPAADSNGDGSVDGDDVITFFEHWDAGC